MHYNNFFVSSMTFCKIYHEWEQNKLIPQVQQRKQEWQFEPCQNS